MGPSEGNISKAHKRFYISKIFCPTSMIFYCCMDATINRICQDIGSTTPQKASMFSMRNNKTLKDKGIFLAFIGNLF